MPVKKAPEPIELSQKEIDEFLEQVEQHLSPKYSETAKALVAILGFLNGLADKKAATIARLVKMIFGIKTESMKNVLGDSIEKPANADEKHETPTPEKEKPKGHGRNGHEAYTGAERITVPHRSMTHGCGCSECKGKCYKTESAVIIRFEGGALIQAVVYELETFRCNLCGAIFRAAAPEGIGEEKYDASVGSAVANMKYGGGLPFYRIEKLQESAGVPLPASTQWEIVDGAAEKARPAYGELIRQAAQGQVIHNDDTTMKVLDLIKENKESHPERKGMFTTGMLSSLDDHKIALFFTGRKHAGENLAELLKQREKSLDPPIQMCDALSRNAPDEFKTLLANCLAHGRRNFTDVIEAFPEECRFVIEILGEVYHNDAVAKAREMPPKERLEFHKENSGPLMKKLKEWLQAQFDERKTEPNSSLGKAIKYMLKHWKPLTLFLRIPGAPLDNNLCEQALKRAILHRKNSLFYKTGRGAEVGDLFMSLIHTCNLNGANPFEYLTVLQRRHAEAAANPAHWLPWTYKTTLAQIAP